MKKSLVITLVALCVVSMLALGCKKEEAVSDTASTDTSMTTGDTAMTDTMATVAPVVLFLSRSQRR
jgi:hypothetical protein